MIFFFISHCNLYPIPRHVLIFYSGNLGNITLPLIAALCRDPSNPFGLIEIYSQIIASISYSLQVQVNYSTND
jgi:hypothetical protein